MTADQVIDLASQDRFSDRAAQRRYVENILYRRRGWHGPVWDIDRWTRV
jgi:hypothetical protein